MITRNNQSEDGMLIERNVADGILGFTDDGTSQAFSFVLTWAKKRGRRRIVSSARLGEENKSLKKHVGTGEFRMWNGQLEVKALKKASEGSMNGRGMHTSRLS
jgi:hypothetical protein